MEEESGNLLRAALPNEWVIHEYKPDYGIDGTIEMFDPVDDNNDVYETLGEHIFFQLKSVRKTTLLHRVARSYRSVLAGAEERGHPFTLEYEAFAYDLEVNELLTVEAMGASLVVVLFVVALDTRTMYMISLTDYIDRVLDRDDPDWRTKSRKRIFIPSQLSLPGVSSVELLRLYGGRPKHMHLFNVAAAQYHQLFSAFDAGRMRPLAARFCEQLLALDVWRIGAWTLPAESFQQLLACRDILAGDLTAAQRLFPASSVVEVPEDGMVPEETTVDLKLLGVWERLESLGRFYEEIVREWGLPTYLGIKLTFGELV